MPAWIAIALPLIQQILKEAPHLKADFQALFSKDAVTDADWDALHKRIASQSYADLVPDSSLPPS